MSFRELSGNEFYEVVDFFFNKGIDAEEAGHRLALLEYDAKCDQVTMIDKHQELIGSFSKDNLEILCPLMSCDGKIKVDTRNEKDYLCTLCGIELTYTP